MKSLIALLAVLLALPAEADELECLAQNLYFEARDQDIEGLYAVAAVTLNRVDDSRWPSTVCEVVKQRRRGVCQFSWFCDGLSDTPKEVIPFQICYAISHISLNVRRPTEVDSNVYWYHNEKVTPYWAEAYQLNRKIGAHYFYSDGETK